MADKPTHETVCYSYRHAAHGGVVHSTDAGDMRDAASTGRVAELLNCTLEDLLEGLAPEEVALWRAEMEKGMAVGGEGAVPKPQAKPQPKTPLAKPKEPVKPLTTTIDPRLAPMRGKHRGVPAVIIASGPSLETLEARAGLDALTVARAEHDTPVVIGVNRARAVYPRCDYLALMDHRLYTEHIADHAGWSHLFRGQESRMFVQDLADWPTGDFLRVRPLSQQVGFSFDLCFGFYRGFTTTLLAMQVAVWLGCDPIYLAGLDLKHSADGKKTHFFGSMPWNRERDGAVDKGGLFSMMLKTFDAVAPLLAARKVRVFNLNPDSAVRCFPFATWDDALAGRPPMPESDAVQGQSLTVGMETT